MAHKAAHVNGAAHARERVVEHERTPAALRVREAILRTLPLEDRLLVVLWYAERLNVREISQVLGVPEAQVMRAHDLIVSQLHAVAA